jgi:hypothetical protein
MREEERKDTYNESPENKCRLAGFNKQILAGESLVFSSVTQL